MKVQPLLLAALIAVASCKSAAHKPSVGLMATPPPNGRVIGFDPSVVGLPGAISDTVYDSAGIISWVKFGPLNTDWRPVPVSQFVTGDPSQAPGLKAPVGFVVTLTDGTASWVKNGSGDTAWVTNPSSGSGTSVTAGTGISVDGGVVSNTAPFGSPISLAQNNDAGTPVTTMSYTNTFTSKTPGTETSGNVFGAKLDGGTINTDISFLNEQPPQLVTTTIAQPSVAWNPRTDVLDVTVGATTLTKLTVTGLDMDSDRIIAVEWVTASGGEAATVAAQSVIRFNNETNGVVGDNTFQRAGTASSMTATAAWIFADALDTASLGMSRGEFSKSPGGLVRGTIWFSVLQGGLRYEEHTTGVGDSTTDVTSIVILPTSGNLAGTGDHYKFYRGRAFAH